MGGLKDIYLAWISKTLPWDHLIVYDVPLSVVKAMAEPTHSSEGAEIPKEKAGSVLSFVVLLVGDEFRKCRHVLHANCSKNNLFYLGWGGDLELQRQATFIGINCCRFVMFCSALTINSAWSGPSASFLACDVHRFHSMVRAIVLPSNRVCISCSNYWSN